MAEVTLREARSRNGTGRIEQALIVIGVLEGLTKVFYPQAPSTVIFIVMAIVLLIRPAGLFGRE